RFEPPAAQWLTQQARCTGETRVGSVPVQWWKTPGTDGQATWHWLRADTAMPWRSMFVSRAADPAVVADYAMTYFPVFAPVAETNLPALVNFCKARAKPAGVPAFAQTVRDLMPLSNVDHAERAARLAALVPGLSHNACAKMTPVRWPDHFVATAVITPISFSDDPYSGLIYYDWPDAASQFAILWQGISPSFRGVVALRKGIGYQPGNAAGNFLCPAIYPGMVRPDWASAAQCQCKGVVEN